jgi:hypothetical protein
MIGQQLREIDFDPHKGHGNLSERDRKPIPSPRFRRGETNVAPHQRGVVKSPKWAKNEV